MLLMHAIDHTCLPLRLAMPSSYRRRQMRRAQHLVLDLDLVEGEEAAAAVDEQLSDNRIRLREQNVKCGDTRHIWLTHQRVQGLAVLESNAVTCPLRPVNGQDGAKDELCVRLNSIKLNQSACTGGKWNMNVRCGWASSQRTTSADQCELTGSRIR